MADISRPVERDVPGNQRHIVFNETEVSGGDIFLVQDSLGRTASYCLIEADADLTFSFNVYRTHTPRRVDENIHGTLALGTPIPSLSAEVFVSGQELSLASGESFEVDNDFAIKDIHIVSNSGSFTVLLS